MFCLSAALLVSTAALATAQELPNEGPVPTTALVSVQSKQPVQLDPAQLKLQVNGHDTPISSVNIVRPSNAQIAILIDDGLRGSFNVQLTDVQNFIRQLPVNTKVLVGYMQNGIVRSSGHFSTEHQSVAAQVRVPLSSPGLSASPYFCLSDFVNHWPASEPGPRFVLMITNGVDPYNGSTSIMNQDSPYVRKAQDDAQRAGVAVYSIYYGDAGIRGGSASFSGSSYLQQVADATGGELLNPGPISPVSLVPLFGQFQKALAESYVLGFNISPGHDRGEDLKPIKVRTSQPGVKLHAPDAVKPGTTE
jgi:hypothetical protein